jgi:hypothetical protein
LNGKQMAAAFNEWMRRFIEDPGQFEAEFRTVATFQAARAKGELPTYGETCVAYLRLLATQQGEPAAIGSEPVSLGADSQVG